MPASIQSPAVPELARIKAAEEARQRRSEPWRVPGAPRSSPGAGSRDDRRRPTEQTPGGPRPYALTEPEAEALGGRRPAADEFVANPKRVSTRSTGQLRDQEPGDEAQERKLLEANRASRQPLLLSCTQINKTLDRLSDSSIPLSAVAKLDAAADARGHGFALVPHIEQGEHQLAVGLTRHRPLERLILGHSHYRLTIGRRDPPRLAHRGVVAPRVRSSERILCVHDDCVLRCEPSDPRTVTLELPADAVPANGASHLRSRNNSRSGKASSQCQTCLSGSCHSSLMTARASWPCLSAEGTVSANDGRLVEIHSSSATIASRGTSTERSFSSLIACALERREALVTPRRSALSSSCRS